MRGGAEVSQLSLALICFEHPKGAASRWLGRMECTAGQAQRATAGANRARQGGTQMSVRPVGVSEHLVDMIGHANRVGDVGAQTSCCTLTRDPPLGRKKPRSAARPWSPRCCARIP